ncbi:MAG: hypothetical protein K2P58_08190 [Hyphomonadaceae bacterium]|nr:hypothetical protein [Hyphomonadaceae bacterium]
MRLTVFVLFAALSLAAPAYAACDATPVVGARAEARAGDNLMATLAVHNNGDSVCQGTRENPNGYMVDFFLSTDRAGPSTWTIYAPTWREDVLLRGGRVSNTNSVPAGGNVRYGAPSYEIGPFTLPAGIPPGAYYLCAGVDMGNRIAESNERNNIACNPIRIRAPRVDLRRGPQPSQQPQPQPQ